MENHEHERRMEARHYESALQTVNFLAREGNYELALQIARYTLEKLCLEKDMASAMPIEENEKIKEIEAMLTRKYIDFRARLEGRHSPYWKTFVNTLIICGTLSAAIVVTAALVVFQFGTVINRPAERFINVFHEQVKTEVPRLTNEIMLQIPLISHRIQDEIPNLSKDFMKLSEEKVDKAIDRKLEKLVDKKLPAIVHEKLKKGSP